MRLVGATTTLLLTLFLRVMDDTMELFLVEFDIAGEIIART
ncbi:MAG: hypothetical protein N2663_03560 [Chlorobi bacterium]|nr:hypothetical protein [Chlorobiota bacterium]